MMMLPGLLFCGEKQVINKYRTTLSAQSQFLQDYIRQHGQGKKNALREGLLNSAGKPYYTEIVRPDGSIIVTGMPDPSMSLICRPDPKDPDSWLWRWHINEHNDSVEIRFYTVEIFAAKDLIEITHIRIPRDAEPEFDELNRAIPATNEPISAP